MVIHPLADQKQKVGALVKRRTDDYYRKYTNRLVGSMKPNPATLDTAYEEAIQRTRETILRAQEMTPREQLDGKEWLRGGSQTSRPANHSDKLLIQVL
jgi:hypothetical protein